MKLPKDDWQVFKMKWSRIHLEKCTVEDEQRREERVKTAVRQKQRMFVSKISVDNLIDSWYVTAFNTI